MANQAYAYPRIGATWTLPPGTDAMRVAVHYRTDGTFVIAVNDLDIVAELDFTDAVGFHSWLGQKVQLEREARAEERIRAAAKSS